MLEDALIELSAKTKQEKKVVDIKLSISAFISSSYISEDRIRLELYRRFSKTTTKKEIYEIQDEMEDRFGRLDIPTKQFVDLIIIKTIAIQKDIKSISNYAMNISINFNNDSKKLIKSKSKDDDDLIYAVIGFLTKI
jgi:transcription-repair coupling factor (superfamily II helicase)